MKGIRILDLENGVVSIKLSDILGMLPENSFHWYILDSDIMPKPEEGEFIIQLEKKISESEKGLPIRWEELILLSQKSFQEIDLVIVGCKDNNFSRNYTSYNDIYAICDIVIEMIDSSFWEVFAKDQRLIDKCAKKFKRTELIESIK